mmetsp:Transcript_25586/g.12117  ORF Transcript_25586/g.12117 Transcript_25586/m.12117 type:complete len:81 (-) Transcript_25586:29-271(-)
MKLVDFGISLTIEHTRYLQTSEKVGSINYMAPEQLIGDKTCISPKSDAYSLGCIAIELWSNRIPFEGLDFLEIVERFKAN